MKYNKINNVLEIGKDILNKYVGEGDVVLDCTVGNGNDTLILAKLVASSGKLYGFDIQEDAIYNTKALLKNLPNNYNIKLIKDSHENIDLYIDEKLDCIIYNLGYLPGGDKNIKTKSSSTINSIEKSLKLLKNNGILLVTTYPGHEEGMKENNILEDFFGNLDQRYFHILKHEFINQINNPPILYLLEKSKESQ